MENEKPQPDVENKIKNLLIENMNPWLTHLEAYRTEHPEKSYKQCMKDAKSSYKRQSGGNPALASAIGSVADLGGKIADNVRNRREQSGFYDREGMKQALKLYKELKWRQSKALLDANKIPKSWSDKKLKHLSGLDKYE